MAAYVERFERDGELPAYDAQAIERARGRGRFD